MIALPPPPLAEQITAIGEQAGLSGVAVAVYDYQTERGFELNGGRLFHAASVIKLAVLLAVFKAAETQHGRLDDPLHVRNRFQSIVDGSVYRIDRDRDGDALCHRRVGRTMRVIELARAMIVRSSNIATNLLIDLVGLKNVQATLRDAGIDGVKMVRGVEDEVAFAQGLNNQLSAAGTRHLLRVLGEGGFLNEVSRTQIREILLAQEFNTMLPARLPAGVRVAHKTGEISTHSHDAGIVYPPNRAPYVVAILTESVSPSAPRSSAVARISAEIYRHLRA